MLESNINEWYENKYMEEQYGNIAVFRCSMLVLLCSGFIGAWMMGEQWPSNDTYRDLYTQHAEKNIYLCNRMKRICNEMWWIFCLIHDNIDG